MNLSRIPHHSVWKGKVSFQPPEGLLSHVLFFFKVGSLVLYSVPSGTVGIKIKTRAVFGYRIIYSHFKQSTEDKSLWPFVAIPYTESLTSTYFEILKDMTKQIPINRVN